MSLKITTAVATSLVAAATDAVNLGTEGPAQLIIWDGTEPVLVSDAVSPTSVILATFDLANPAFGAPAVIGSSVEALSFALADVQATAAGEASFFRIYDRDGNVVMQGPISEDGSEPIAPLVINQTTLTMGADVSVTNLVVGMSVG